jgi:hypothetical protein
MARPRKPTAELKLNGAFAKNPNRKRVDPKTSGPVGDPPPSLSLELHATWHELAGQAPINVLRSADRALLEMATRLLFSFRASPILPEPALIGQFLKCLSAMGMTPVDRSKVHAPQDKPDNPFAKFAGKASEARKSAPVH